MPFILDPSKQFFTVKILYTLKVNKDNAEFYKFIRTKEDYEEALAKGCVLESDLQKQQPGIPNMPIDPSKVIHAIETGWKRPTWKEANVIFSQALKPMRGMDGEMGLELDPIIYRENKLKLFLKKWDIQGPNGEVLEVNPANIDILPPAIANELLDTFNRYTEPSQEDLKN